MSQIDAFIIICTRQESRRLPRKAFKKIAGIRAVDHILMRLYGCGFPIFLATPPGQKSIYEKELESEISPLNFFEGNAQSPLHRMAELINSFESKPKWIVRVTHDDILVDSQTMVEMLNACEKQNVGYGYSPEIIEGAGVEVIRAENIVHAAERRSEPTEFVSYFVKGPGMPYDGILKYEPRWTIRRPYRLTMDYEQDAFVLEVILRELGSTPKLDEIALHLDSNKHLLEINKQPDVTFYTCVYNGDKWIEDCVTSVITSGVENYEYVIVDDKSNDLTLSKISEFLPDKSISVVLNENNMGLSSSSNVAISRARGKYIMRVDADDALISVTSKNVIRKMVRKIEDGATIVYPSYFEMTGDGKVVRANCDPTEKYHVGCALMERKNINELRFKEGLRHWDGVELRSRALTNGFKVDTVDDLMWMYRRHEKSMTLNDLAEREEALRDINGG